MKLITLTPIHIGNGETLKPLSYVMDKNYIYVLDMDKFFNILSENQREQYLKWIDPILNRIAELDEKIVVTDDRNQKRNLRKLKREEEAKLSIDWFIKNRLGQNPINIAKKCLAYQIPYSIQPRRDGFKTHIKDIQNRAYIPGSEIKGAIRTSLLYEMLQEKENYKIFKNLLKDFSSIFKSGASTEKKLEKLRKIANAQEEILLRGKKKDAKFDLLKFIKITDSNSIEPQRLKIEATQMLGTNRYTRTWIETIIPKTEFNFDLSIQKRNFLDELGLKEKENWLSINKFLKNCYYRSKEILEQDEKYFSHNKTILRLIHKLKEQNQPTSPLLRLGAGQGFLGTTVDLVILKNDPQLYEVIREGVSFQRRWRTQKNNFPKTRRVINDPYNNPLNILGWVKILPD